MPELPEVETVKNSLKRGLGSRKEIQGIRFFRKNLRNPLPLFLERELKGSKILHMCRLAKYILIFTDHGILISHLGMTGTWRFDAHGEIGKHDHIEILVEGLRLIYRDPRRFGVFDWVTNEEELMGYPSFVNLGPDPVDGELFDANYLFEVSRRKKNPIKSFIMKQEVVVGVGNIYASEALFRCRILPTREAGSLRMSDCIELVSEIKSVLFEAIEAGGSSISDFKQTEGESGYFQNHFFVYGKGGEPCPNCQKPIKKIVQQSRSSFFCEFCQV